jgi:hypothetical protein
MKFENIINLKLKNFEIVTPQTDKEKIATTPPVDISEDNFANYPWDQCIADQTKAYGSKDIAERVCGKIKAENQSKTEMDITPNPCYAGYEPIGLKDDGSPNCVPKKK